MLLSPWQALQQENIQIAVASLVNCLKHFGIVNFTKIKLISPRVSRSMKMTNEINISQDKTLVRNLSLAYQCK